MFCAVLLHSALGLVRTAAQKALREKSLGEQKKDVVKMLKDFARPGTADDDGY